MTSHATNLQVEQVDKVRKSSPMIDQLSTDVFLDIVHLVVDNKPRDVTWVRLMMVCRSWRAALRDDPGLWSHIDVARNAYFVDLCLQRSQDRPVHFFNSKWRAAGFARVLPDNLHRTRSLEIRDHKDTEFRPLLEILSSSCGPQLETLELLLQSSKGPCLSCTILPTNYPLLRSLSLCRVAIAWTGPILAGLSNLSLDLTQTDPSDACMPSEEQLLDVIEASPGLETLTIKLNEGQLRPTAVRSPILLSHLKSFVLSTRQETWMSLLSHLTLSETTYLQLTPSGPMAIMDRDHPVSSLFPICYQSVLRQATRAKTLRLCAMSSCFFFKVHVDVEPNPDNGLVAIEYTDVDLPPALFGPALVDVAELFSASPITSIVLLGHEGDVGEKDWRRVFCALPHLETLLPRDYGGLKSLWTVLGSRQVDGQSVYCPHLRVVRPYSTTLTDTTIAVHIAQCLRSRAASGHSLSVPLLEDIVGGVKYD